MIDRVVNQTARWMDADEFKESKREKKGLRRRQAEGDGWVRGRPAAEASRTGEWREGRYRR